MKLFLVLVPVLLLSSYRASTAELVLRYSGAQKRAGQQSIVSS